ncbi:MAG: Rpn family recombination-promoting nuclease/putative transposase [Blautia sp.]|nr:Rpn family recombination-promoting nuclease/putative transposase [Blautia sp.]
MGNRDKTEKLFVACSDVFVEIINGLVYHGEEILSEKDMLPGPTESIYPKAELELSSQFQDCSMYDVRGGRPCALYTLENQSDVDSRMPLRCAGYDGAAYRRQYKQGSGQGIYPVISVVLNWGEKPWNAATSIRELLDYPISRMAEDYLDKNRIHVFDMRFLSRTVRERFEGDVRVVLDYLSDNESLIRRNQKLRNPEEVMRMLHALSGDERYLDNIKFVEEEGGRRVCPLLDSMVNKGLQQGIQQGIQTLIATYKEFGVTYEAAAAGVKEKYGLEDAEVQRDMAMYW